MNHDELYQRFPPPGAIAPQPGDKIRVNYGHQGMQAGYIVKSVHQHGDTMTLICHLEDNEKSRYYLNGYRMIDGRCVRHAMEAHTQGYIYNGGGRDGDGRDEILIERRGRQPSLFDAMEAAA